jgi:hypothetical protein
MVLSRIPPADASRARASAFPRAGRAATFIKLDVPESSYTNTGTSVSISAQVQYRIDDNDNSIKDAPTPAPR